MRIVSLMVLLAIVPACDASPSVDASGTGAERTRALDATPDWRTQLSGESAPEPTPYPGFSWVEADLLAGMPRPGAMRPLAVDLASIADRGVDILVSLTEVAPPLADVQAAGLESVHYPVKDFTAPTLDQLSAFVAIVRAARAGGRAVGVHCDGGRGRTGTFLAAWFIANGLGADQALTKIRTLRPGSVETASQERALRNFAAMVRAAR